ncbi:MAG: ABC transporter ATP-binding protein [Anaerolineae bacterium]
MADALRLVNVAYSYDDGKAPLEALAEVSLTIASGEFVTVVGPSGCGKTTLLRLIAGLTEPTSGRVELLGDNSRIGFVFQSGALMPWRTVRANIMLPLELAGAMRGEMASRVDSLIRLVGLAGFEESYPRQLSGGMQQRAALARALADDPSLLLLDEPFASLDALSRERMNEELQRIWMATGKTVLMVTHSIEEAVFLSDRVVTLSHRPGRVKDILFVPLARPRAPAVRYFPEFSDIAARVRETIDRAERENGFTPVAG